MEEDSPNAFLRFSWNFLYPKITVRSVTLLGNSWRNSCIPFLLLIWTFRFTYGEWKIRQNIKESQNIMTTTAVWEKALIKQINTLTRESIIQKYNVYWLMVLTKAIILKIQIKEIRILSKAYIEPCQTSMVELFWKNNLQFLALFAQKAPPYMHDRVLNKHLRVFIMHFQYCFRQYQASKQFFVEYCLNRVLDTLQTIKIHMSHSIQKSTK